MLNFFYRHCERITSSGSYIPELDGLRFLALLMVFGLHLNHYVLGHPGIEGSMSEFQSAFAGGLEFGAFGVQLFFSISGFILALPFARHALCQETAVSMKRFYFRRLTRLEPPLIIHLTIMLVVYAIFMGKPFLELLPHYFATVTYLHSHLYGYASPLNPMTWSLEVEVQFYLSTPLLCLVYRVRSLITRRGVMLGSIFLFAWVSRGLPQTLLPTQLPYFLGGLLLADIYLVEWKSSPVVARWGDALAVVLAALFGIASVFHKVIPLFHAWLALLIFGFFYAVFRGVLFRRLFTIRFLAVIGGMCYTFYLYHLAVIATCHRVLARSFEGTGYFETLAIYFCVIGIANLVICSVLFVLFERPFMRWRPQAGNWLNGIVNRPRREIGS